MIIARRSALTGRRVTVEIRESNLLLCGCRTAVRCVRAVASLAGVVQW